MSWIRPCRVARQHKLAIPSMLYRSSSRTRSRDCELARKRHLSKISIRNNLPFQGAYQSATSLARFLPRMKSDTMDRCKDQYWAEILRSMATARNLQLSSAACPQLSSLVQMCTATRVAAVLRIRGCWLSYATVPSNSKSRILP